MLCGLSVGEVQRIVAESVGSSPLPQLRDESVRARALQIARRRGLIERFRAELTPDAPIGVIPYGVYREFQRTGNRTHCQKLMYGRRTQLMTAAAACWLGMGYERYLDDLLWADCETTTWKLPAHEGSESPIELHSATLACEYAMVLGAVGDRLSDEVCRRVVAEIHRRVLDHYLDPPVQPRWKTGTSNWNAVCTGAVLMTAMLLEKDPQKLARFVIEALESLEYFLSGFTADGGCTEGPGYWRYGFGWFARLAAGLYDFTGGRIHLMSDERLERICRYPLAVNVAPGHELAFADAQAGYMDPITAVLINRFHDVKELLGLCRLTDDGELDVASLWGLLVCDDRRVAVTRDAKDSVLGDLAVAKLRAGAVTLGVKAGHNGEHHNHNDIGSFVVFGGSTCFLADPGAPVYSRKTFSPRRYESVYCSSRGHSVPVVNGQLQKPGEEYRGTLSVEGANATGAKRATVEFASAYGPEAGLDRLTRTIELPPGRAEVRVSDSFAFSSSPAALEEVFIALKPCRADGESGVRIDGGADGSAVLRAVEAPGAWRIEELTEESLAESLDGTTIRRLVFTPAARERNMTLRFVLELTPA
ncbi:MAG TPA: heparinase II/III family protein [Phycisphaerae bacterium]|nr:heparinase II/III family protein [Phycisphaerae bacterium]